MKSICMLVQNYYDMDIRVRRKAEALVAAGYAVDVLGLRPAPATEKSYVLNGVNVYTLSLGKQRGSLGRYVFEYFAFLLWAWWKLTQLSRLRAYDVVDVNNLPDFLVFAGFLAKWKGAKLVFDMHEITPEFLMSKYQVDASHWLVRVSLAIERASMRFADYVTTINEPIQRLLEGRGLPPGGSTVIMNSVDEGLFREGAQLVSPPDPSAGKAKFIMMYHGTLTRIYGLDIALEAFAQTHADLPGAEFWILGKGPEERVLREQVRRLGLDDKVRFIGSVLPQEIPAWLRRSDVGVLATRQDVFLDLSFSNKLSEYIIMDKPVIASRIRTVRHYFSEEALAFFEPGNPADLARQMARLYRDDRLRNQFARQAAKEYKPICWEVMKKRYLALMGKLINPATEPLPTSDSPPSSKDVEIPSFPHA
jgi:glycosyltransferase involved in cell wall biosynthesis